MFYFLLMVFILFVYNRQVRKLPTMDGLNLVFANKGSGKTTFIARIVFEYNKKNSKLKKRFSNGVFSTVPVRGALQLNPNDIGFMDFKSSILLIDEAHIVFDNRKSLSEKVITWFRLQRHAKCLVIVISQSHSDLNVNLRRVYDRIYLMKREFFEFSSLQEIVKYIGISKESEQMEDLYKIIPWWFGGKYYFYRPPYYAYFDSWIMNMDLSPVVINEWEFPPLPTLKEVFINVKKVYKIKFFNMIDFVKYKIKIKK